MSWIETALNAIKTRFTSIETNYLTRSDANKTFQKQATAFSGNWDDLKKKPAFSEVATSGKYSDLTGTPEKIMSLETIAEKIQTPSNFYNCYKIVYGNGIFLAATGFRGFCRSTDGIHWEEVFLKISFSFSDDGFIFKDGYFMIFPDSAGYKKMLYSIDGTNWNERSIFSIDYPLNAKMAYNEKFFIAVDSRGGYSGDKYGQNWNKISFNGVDAVSPSYGGIVYGDNKFVIVYKSIDSNKTNTFIYSEDGKKWQKGILPQEANWNDIKYFGNKFWILGGSNSEKIDKILCSEDLVAWEVFSLPIEGRWEYLAYENGLYAIGEYTARKLYLTSDWENWEEIDITGPIWFMSFFNNKLYVVEMGNLLFIFQKEFFQSQKNITKEVNHIVSNTLARKDKISKVGFTGEYSDLLGSPELATIATSGEYRNLLGAPTRLDLGYTWEYFNYSDIHNKQIKWTSSLYNDGKYFIIGEKNLMTSTDGKKWTNKIIDVLGDYLIYGNRKYVCVGDKKCAISTDAVSWTSVEIDFKALCACFIDNTARKEANRFIVGGEGKILYSEDGTTWNEIENTSLSGDNWVSIVLSDKTLYAFGEKGTIAYSYNGLIWSIDSNSNSDILGANFIKAIAGRSSQFLVYTKKTNSDFSITRDAYLYDSYHGVWTKSLLPFDSVNQSNIYEATIYDKGNFLIFFGDTCYASSDGVGWIETKMKVAPRSGLHIIKGADSLVAVSEYGDGGYGASALLLNSENVTSLIFSLDNTVPKVTTSDSGKILQVSSEGKWEAENLEIPDTTPFIIDYENPKTDDYTNAIAAFNSGKIVLLKKGNEQFPMTGYDDTHCYFGGSDSAYLPGGYVNAVYAHIGANGENYYWYPYKHAIEAAGLYSEDEGNYYTSTNVMGQLQEVGEKLANTTQSIPKIESLDTSNIKTFRSIEDGIYVLDGYFAPYTGSDSTFIFDPPALVSISSTDSETHVQIFEAYNNQVQHLVITDTSCEETYVPLNDIAKSAANSLPSVTASDNGKILQVVDGSWAATTISNANGVSF